MTQDMDARYGHTEQRNYEAVEQRSSEAVGKLLADSKQALGRHMEQLRSNLGVGKEQPRSSQGVAYGMPKVCVGANFLFPRWEPNIPTLGTKHSHAGNKTGLRLFITLLLMIFLGVSSVWGQSNYVLMDNDGRLVQTNNTTLTGSTSFNPQSCIWEYGEYNSSNHRAGFTINIDATTYYLSVGGWVKIDASTSIPTKAILLTPLNDYNSGWKIDGNDLKSQGNYYVYWDSDNNLWALVKDPVPENRAKPYSVTTNTGSFTEVTATIDGNYSPITSKKNYIFAVTPSVKEISYTKYSFNSTSHYWYNYSDHNALPANWGTVNVETLTKTWSIIEGGEYASINATGELTVTDLPASGRATVTMRCVITDNASHSYTVEKSVVLEPEMTEISSLAEITDANGRYKLNSDFSTTGTPANGIGTTQAKAFKGTIDGGLVPITGTWDKPLFSYVENATIRNVIIQKVSISTNTTAGAIAANAYGATRIYNCGINSGSVSGGSSNVVGGLVGNLYETSRVINCYSYADITGGKNKAGIVGYNRVASTQSSLTTMVMNCMFYGDIVEGGTDRAPIYGGTEISNVAGGLNNYNYYRYDSPFSKNKIVNKYNRALAMEEKFITRFERYRLLLNSNKKLAAKYTSTTETTVAPEEMAKWVLETADLTNNAPMPYPVLKAQGKYPSIINIDAKHATTKTERNKGGLMGTLIVNIGGMGSNAPSGASITTGSLTLNRTDKDFDHYNYNYDKVQLPYYNDVGTGNYTENKVVTGWKITAFTGGTVRTFTEKDEWGGYNFADRNCTNKDKYSVSKRVFSQGAYFDVPTGVTAITIEPYWATAAYVSDQTYDVVYDKSYARQTFSLFGDQYTNGADIDLHGDGNTQKVYTSIENARSALNISGGTVYDHAVVLVGNVHQSEDPTKADTPFTVMSIDMNHDNEPDYSYIFGHNNRQPISPIRYDFLNIAGIAEAQMPKGATTFRNVSICNLKDWFEITNTCVVNFSQFEYENSKGSNNATTKSSAPLILLGGTFEQFVSTQKTTLPNKTKYIHVGGNAWFAKFGNGTHSDGNGFTPHIPISVTGGDYDEFYLSGTYQPNITNMQSDNAECYVSGGRFGEMAATSLEQIQGDVRWDINYADITNFYGGGTNANKPLTGSIQVDIANSYVNTYCGGPKFGDMSNNKTVTSNATNCQFGTFFGAGYGGNSYNRVKYWDASGLNPKDKQGEYTNDRGKFFDGSSTNAPGGANYGKKGKGVATDFDYEFFVWSTGTTGGRFYVKFVSFSLATTKNVTSNLKGCTISGNFYGGGNLGKVDGTATSVLDDCTVEGSVYGGGYSASLPTIAVRNTPAFVEGKEPSVNNNIGMFEMGEINTTEEYEWKHVENLPGNGESGMESTPEGNFVYTNENLNTLGQVKNSNLIIMGSTTVAGSVYGGGALASMETSGETKVNLFGGTINGDVYGGGQGRLPGGKDANNHDLPEVKALVGSASVNLNGIDYSTDEATRTLYTSWGLESASTNAPYVVPDNNKGCVVKGCIFGCNNLNGTPKGTATVHIYKTQNVDATRITNPAEGEKTAKVKGRYDVLAVYGGGNLAAYEPNATLTTGTDAEKEASKPAATVIIDGCDRTSIQYVYGGGNAASTPATNVAVNGTFEVMEVFGGGNGKDDIVVNNKTKPNPGANVGFYDYSAVEDTYPTKENRQEESFTSNYVYGSGKAAVNIFGGKIHRVFGGSNTKGNVRQTAVTMLDERSSCDFLVDEAYGGGKSAPMDAEAKLLMACIPGLKNAYGGAEAADIQGNVELNITNGTFDRVFGGNNVSGTIRGSITVNIEEVGCKPIIIGELYGGGNLAGYSIYGYKEVNEGTETEPNMVWKPRESNTDSPTGIVLATENTPYAHPQVNVKSFTSIGNIYGGGYGTSAVMVGNPTVEINEVEGEFENSDDSVVPDNATTPSGYPIPPHAKNTLGAIKNVFGGGNAAKVIGNTTVKIGTRNEWEVTAPKKDTNGKTLYEEDGVTPQTEEVTKTVKGANIVGNVYGGGNNAEVTGSTNVTIGKRSE